MPQFSIDQMAKVTILNVNVRSELHGEEHVPAADIWVRPIALGTTTLAQADR